MKKLFFALLFIILLFPTKVNAQYSTGVVEEVVEQQEYTFDNETFYTQRLLVRPAEGDAVKINMGSEFQPLNESQLMDVGDNVVISEQMIAEGQSEHIIADSYRLPILFWLLVGFFLVVLTVAGLKGVFSIGGMFLSLGVLSTFVIPQILSGVSPLLITMIAAVIIASITVYLSHGFKASSHIALASILITLLGVTLLSTWYVELAHLSGIGSEEAAFLQVGETAKINLQGLLLSGIMLGALGVLDDITISQVATVFELKRANKKLTFEELYQRGMRVGKDHVASLVNTLVLAYAGANLPLFLLFTLNEESPLWVTLNNQLIAEEVVRTLMGSIGLVAAVPLTTAFAAYWIAERKLSDKDLDTHGHVHG